MDALEVVATWKGGYEAAVQARDHWMTIDEPVESGGADHGPMPTEALCIAVASCFCLAVAHVARRDGIRLGDLEVEVDAERAGSELRYGHMVVTVRAPEVGDAMEQLLVRARRVCWVSNILAEPPEVEYRSHLEVP
jgi:putative redox protein